MVVRTKEYPTVLWPNVRKREQFHTQLARLKKQKRLKRVTREDIYLKRDPQQQRGDEQGRDHGHGQGHLRDLGLDLVLDQDSHHASLTSSMSCINLF